jgi:hypothetical protein
MASTCRGRMPGFLRWHWCHYWIRPRPGIFNSAPIRSANWYFLSFDSRNQAGNRAVGRVLVFMVLDHAAIRPLTIPSPNCRVWLPDSDVAIPAREGDNPIVVIVVVFLDVKSTLACRGRTRIYMRAGQQTGRVEGGPTNLFLREKLTEMLYIPGVWERYSVICGKANASGRHISVTLKGPSQLGESLWSPSQFRIRLRTKSPTSNFLLCTNLWW